MRTIVTEHAGLLLARIEDDEFVFEVNSETIEPTDTVGCNDLPVFRRAVRRNPEMTYNRPYDVTLRFRRDGGKVGSIYNDDGTERTKSVTDSRVVSPTTSETPL